MRYLMFSMNNQKRLWLVVILILLINLFSNYLVQTNYQEYFEYQFPEDMLLTYSNEFNGKEEVISISDYNAYMQEDTETNIRGIDLEKVGFNKDNSSIMRRQVQDKLNAGIKALKQNIAFMYDSETFNMYEINIPLKTLDLDHLVIGKYPLQGEVLISEVFASELITQNSEFSTYSDLIGTKYDNYKISGVYASSYNTLSDEIIMSSNKKTKNSINLVANYDKNTTMNLKQEGYDYKNSADYSSLNYTLIFKVLELISSLVIFVILMRKEMIAFKKIAINNRVNKISILLNFFVPIGGMFLTIYVLFY